MSNNELSINNSGLDAIVKETYNKHFFEPDKHIEHWPTYSDEQFEEINKIVNSNAYSPFYLETVEKNIDKDTLFVGGYFKTFDDVVVNVEFHGVYGPIDKGGLFDALVPEDSFSEIKIHGEVTKGNAIQQKLLSLISLRDSKLDFRKRDSLDIDYEKYNSTIIDNKSSASGLSLIKKIGKKINFYNGVHQKEKLAEIFSEVDIFLKEVNESDYLHFEKSHIGINISEFTESSDRDSLMKMFNDINKDYFAKVDIFAETSKNDSYTKVTKEIETGKWNITYHNSGLLQEYPFGRELLEADDGQIRYFFNKFNFIFSSLGISVYDEGDMIDNMYISEWDSELIKARQEILNENPDYVPLVRTFDESNIFHLDYEFSNSQYLEFKTLLEYTLFLEMTSLLSENSIEDIIESGFIGDYLDKDDLLKERVMSYYDAYKTDSNNYRSLFLKKDVAYQLAKERMNAKD